MADVSTYAVSGEPIKNNASISCVMPDGTIHEYQHGVNETTDLDSKLTDKFDDVDYYTN